MEQNQELGWKYYSVMDQNNNFKGVLTLRDVIKQLHRDPNVLTRARGEACDETGKYIAPSDEGELGDDEDVLDFSDDVPPPFHVRASQQWKKLFS